MNTKLFLMTLPVAGIMLAAALTYGKYSVHKEATPKGNTLYAESFQKSYERELDELQRIVKRYDTDLFLSGDISYYEEKAGNWERTEKKPFSSIVMGASACFTVDGAVTLQDNGVGIMVDHTEKIILVNEAADGEVLPVTGNSLSLEELAANMESIALQRMGAVNLLTLRLKPETPGIFDQCEIRYRPSDYKLEKITYTGTQRDLVEAGEISKEEQSAYEEVVVEDGTGNEVESGYLAKGTGIKLEMEYKEERKPRRAEVDIGKYVTKKAGEYVPAPAYRNYMIHN